MTRYLLSRYLSDSKTLCAILVVLCVLVENCAPARPQIEGESQVPVDLSDLSLVIHYPTPTFEGLPGHQYLIISPEVATRAGELAGTGGVLLVTPLVLAFNLFIGLPHALYEGAKELTPAEQTLKEAIRTNIPNPSRLTQERLLELLASEKGLSHIRELKEAQEPLGDDELYGALSAKYGNVTLLDIDPQRWGLREVSKNYELFYDSRARLIDLKVPQITWQHKCTHVDKEPNSLEELAMDSAARLKQKIERAAEACTQEFIYHLSGK